MLAAKFGSSDVNGKRKRKKNSSNDLDGMLKVRERFLIAGMYFEKENCCG